MSNHFNLYKPKGDKRIAATCSVRDIFTLDIRVSLASKAVYF